jgi:hypothetical protein
MEAHLMRPRLMRRLLAVAILTLLFDPAHADGRCDLNTLVGYTLLFGKPIDGYIQGSIRKKGYEGCEPDRVLVFADGMGLRCKGMVRQHLDELPTGYLFGRNVSDLILCVDGLLIDVQQTN